jgi:hypothetical protein
MARKGKSGIVNIKGCLVGGHGIENWTGNNEDLIRI